MKHYSIKILIVLILILSLFKIAPVHAENASMSEVYVSITDAKSTISDNSKKDSDKKKAIKQVRKEINALKVKDNKEGKAVKNKLKEVESAKTSDDQADKLSDLTKALITYENTQSSKDASGQIKELKQAVDAKDEPIQKAIKNKNRSELESINNSLNQIWPYVEGKIQTKNNSLYTTIEDKIPYYQSILDDSNKERVKDGLKEINNDIKDTVGTGDYTFVDVMVIFLREGLEVLLIVMTLTTMTRKVKDHKGTSSVIGGALLGLVLSIALAVVLISTIGNNGIIREGMEAVLGIVAVILMYVVGVWMHNRSSAKRWNKMIQSMYQNAISNGNLVLLGTIGLISVLREGVEVIIFYMGMIGSIKTQDFIIGIVIAIVILIIFALLFRFIVKLIPVHYIFRVLSILIFIMTFKMLGVSIQKAQLLGWIPQHSIEGLPTVSWIGFYPSVETIVAQIILVILILLFVFKQRKKNQQ